MATKRAFKKVTKLIAAENNAIRNIYIKVLYMCYNQTGDISTLNGTSLKLVDKFTYVGSSVSSTEKNIDTRLTKRWAAIDSLSIIWESDLTDKIKTQFLPGSGRIDTAIWMHYLDAN